MTAITTKSLCPQYECLVKASLKSRVLVPADVEYKSRQESYWSIGARIQPACIVRPESAEEVSIVIKSLVTAKEKFAVRSGGHTQWAGSNNIEGGVTVDLGLLNWVKFNEATETVDLGPGGRWGEVYAKLQKHGRVVAGGREGNVGVAGLILGGGNTFLTARKGFACDNVVSYEVVLADGSIITADTDNNSDLFRALKGGSNNFGVVTNFKMNAIKCDRVWGGITIFSKDIAQDVIQALSDFTENISNDVDSNLLCFFTYMGMYEPILHRLVSCSGCHILSHSYADRFAPDFEDIVILAAYVQVAGVANAPAYEKWLALPQITTTCKMTTVADIAADYAQPLNYHCIWFTACFKNDKRIVAKTAELHAEMVEELKDYIPDGDFVTQCLFQPLPKLFGQHSSAAGGNIMGMEGQKHNGYLMLACAQVRTREQEAFAYEKVKAWVQGSKDFAATIEDGNLDWIYLNYADPSQNPLASYGIENVRTMRDVARKYDPEQIFQKLCPGGFKVSTVKL